MAAQTRLKGFMLICQTFSRIKKQNVANKRFLLITRAYPVDEKPISNLTGIERSLYPGNHFCVSSSMRLWLPGHVRIKTMLRSISRCSNIRMRYTFCDFTKIKTEARKETPIKKRQSCSLLHPTKTERIYSGTCFCGTCSPLYIREKGRSEISPEKKGHE